MIIRTNATHKGPVSIPDGSKMGNSSESSNGIGMENHAGVQDGSSVALFGQSSITGRVIVVERGSAVTAEFELDGPNSAVQEVNDPNTTFAASSGTASSINAHWGGSAFEVSNNLDNSSAADFSVISME